MTDISAFYYLTMYVDFWLPHKMTTNTGNVHFKKLRDPDFRAHPATGLKHSQDVMPAVQPGCEDEAALSAPYLSLYLHSAI